jgi:RNA polymerase sigma factor (sigma-70 family)
MERLTDERRAIAAEFYPLAVRAADRIARGARYAGGSAHPDDVRSCASMAIVRLVADWDPGRDGEVKPHLERAMRFAIIRELRSEFGKAGCGKKYQRNASHVHFSALPDGPPDVAEARGDAFAQIDGRDAVDAALAHLPPKNAEVCDRHYVNGERAEDVAAALGATRNSVLHRMKAGRRTLRAYFARQID